jgi:hypothetical protein
MAEMTVMLYSLRFGERKVDGGVPVIGLRYPVGEVLALNSVTTAYFANPLLRVTVAKTKGPRPKIPTKPAAFAKLVTNANVAGAQQLAFRNAHQVD